MIQKLLTKALQKENIFLEIEAENANNLIREIVSRLENNEAVKDVNCLADEAVTREEEMPTGIQSGIALPHARCNAVKEMVVAFARPSSPVDFSGPDGIPADLVFFSAIPSRKIDEYLKMTAYLVRLLAKEEVLESLRAAKSSEDVFHVLGIHTS